MAEEGLDDLFRRFVQERDVGAVGELFDHAAPQLARIAWHLTHDANGVEDLVQATFLTALGSAREFDVERPVMPWLLGILVNHARSARRLAGRKPEVLAGDVVDTRTPEAELERREVREVVERAVAELPDTYRDVVSTWLIEGAKPTEIAQRTGKPAATVRVQLRRGLELLRGGLPVGVAGLLATNGWSASSFAASRELVLNQAARVARTLAPTSALVAGGILVTSKWFLIGAAALVTAAGVGWFVHSNGVQPATVASAAVVNANELHVSTPPAPAAVEERNEVAAPPKPDAREAVATPAPGWWLIGDVDGASASDKAHLTSPGKDWNADVTGSHFEVEIPAIFEAFRTGSRGANAFTVRYDSPRFMPTHVQVMVPESANLDADYTKERIELHMQLAPQLASLVLTGRVTAPVSFDASRTVVALYALEASGKLANSPREEARCSNDGSFRVRSSIDGAHAFVAALPGLRPATRMVAAESSGRIDLGVIGLDIGEHLTGSVQAAARVAGLIASMSEPNQELVLDLLKRPSAEVFTDTRLAWVKGRFEWDKLPVAVDASGAFRIDGLAPVAYRIGELMGTTLGSETEVGELSYVNDADDPTFVASRDTIVLANPRCTIRLDVRAGGVPVDGARVVLGIGSSGRAQSGFRGHLADLVWSGNRSATVRVMKDGWASSEVVITPAEAVPGAIRVIELAPQTGLTSVALLPRIACSNSADTYSVQLFPLDKNTSASVDAYPNGTFHASESEWRFDNVAPGRYRIDAQALGTAAYTSWCFAPSPQIKLAAGESVVRELSFVNGGRLAITVFDEHAATARVKLNGEDGQLDWTYFDAQKGESPHESTLGGRLGVRIGVRVEITNVFEPGMRTLTITLSGNEQSKRERTVDIVPGRTTELVVDFSKPDER